MLKTPYMIISVILVLCLSGCGFKLRNAQSLPPGLQTMYYQTDNPYGEFEILFKRSLTSSKINLLPNPSKLAPIIHISAEDSPPTTTSSVSSSSARVYTLTYKSTIGINDASGKVIVPPQTISVSLTLTLQHDEMVEMAPQVAIVKREMMQELIVNIFNVLCAKNTFKALNKTP
jgi:LPS-assembly lipoprotein